MVNEIIKDGFEIPLDLYMLTETTNSILND